MWCVWKGACQGQTDLYLLGVELRVLLTTRLRFISNARQAHFEAVYYLLILLDAKVCVYYRFGFLKRES